MKNGTMLYRCPGSEEFEGVRCETTVVEVEEVEAMMAEGWCSDWMQAKAAHEGVQAQLAATEAEMQELEKQLAAAGVRAVHKGRGVWAILDAEGKEVETGLTKEQAQAKAAG